MPILSVIVPVYNKEKYIDACIQSILSQTFADFELILVNDGSTDQSGSKCEYYKTIDTRVTVINQENSGVSSARNIGLKTATGTYIGFIDSDDTIEKNMYEILVHNIVKYQADISVCRMRVIYPNKTVDVVEDPNPKVYSNDEALSLYLEEKLDMSANNKIYKASTAHKALFEGRFYEDILYGCKLFLMSDKTVLQNVVLYNYIIRDNSVSLGKFSEKNLEIIDVSAKIVDMVSKKNPNCIAEAQSYDVISNLSLLNLILLTNKRLYLNQYNRIKNTLNAYNQFIHQSPKIRKKHKYAYIMFTMSPLIYTFFMHAYCKLTKSDAIARTTTP